MRALLVFLIAVVAPAAAGAQDAPTRWTAREELRIGSRDAPDRTLTRVTQVRIGPDGLMYVGQPVDRTIRVFDTDGAEVRRIGRQGRGPGEFEWVTGFGFLADTLYATDSSLGRVSLFRADGAFIRTFTLRFPALDDHTPTWYSGSTPRTFLSDGTAAGTPGMPVMLLESGIIDRVPWLRVSRDGELLDTMAWQDLAQKPVEIASGGNRYYALVPFAAPPLALVLADGSGMAVIDRTPAERGSGTFRVTRIGVEADTQYVREYEYSPVRMTDGAVAEAVATIEARLSRRGPAPKPAEIERALRGGGHVPASFTPVTAVASGADGSLWLRREDVPGAAVRWDVLDPEGVLQATLELPRRVTVEAVSGDVLVGVELDELDVPYVVRYRIGRHPPAEESRMGAGHAEGRGRA